MIKSFRHRGLRRLFERDDKSQVRPDMLDKIENVLAKLDTSTIPDDMDLPGFRLHPLKGDMRGFLGRHGSGKLADCLALRG